MFCVVFTYCLCEKYYKPIAVHCGSDGKVSTMGETWVRSLGWEDSLEKEMATRSSTLA